MASDPQGKSTPNTNKGIGGGCHIFTRQISAGPALISEFNPLAEPMAIPAQEGEITNVAQKLDPNLLQQVLVDNYIQTQNVLGPSPPNEKPLTESPTEQARSASKGMSEHLVNGLGKANRNAKSGNVGVATVNTI